MQSRFLGSRNQTDPWADRDAGVGSWRGHCRSQEPGLVDVRPGPGQPVAELPPLGRVDIQGLQVAGRDPADIGGLVVDCRRTADWAAEEDQLPLLPDLAIAVGDDV